MKSLIGWTLFFVTGTAVGAGLVWMFGAQTAEAPAPVERTQDADALREAEARADELAEQLRQLEADLVFERSQNKRLAERLEAAKAEAEAAAQTPSGDEVAVATEDEGEGDGRGRRGRGRWDEELTEEQILEMLQSENAWDRMRALRSLDQLSDKSLAIQYALEALEGGGRERWMAIEALSEIGGPQAVAALTGLLNSEDDGRMRGRLAQALAEMGDPTAIPALKDAFAKADGYEQIRLASALKTLGDSSASATLGQGAVTNLSSEDGGVRREAVRTISALSDPTYNVQLVNTLTDSSSDVRREALRALARQGTVSELPAVLAMAADPVESVAREAERAAEMIQNPEARTQQGGGRTLFMGGPGGDRGGRGGRGGR